MSKQLIEAAPTEQENERWRVRGNELDVLIEEGRMFAGQSPWQEAQARLKRNLLARWSRRFLLAFGFLALIAPLLPLPSPVALDLDLGLAEPVPPWELFMAEGYVPNYWKLNPLDAAMAKVRETLFGDLQTASWMGRDSMGRDVLSRIVWGSRTSFTVALLATFVSLVIGVSYGAVAGLIGGRLDRLMMRVVDMLYSLPFVFVVIFVLGLLEPSGGRPSGGSSSREQVFFIVIGAIWWLTMARVVRGQVLSLERSGFIQSARAMGAGTFHILTKHVVPNVLSVVIVYLTLTIPSIMLFEAFLSFLGLGIEAPKVSWGLLAVDGTESINPIQNSWWLVVWPSLAMGSTLLALNFLGDGLRDALDPKLRGKS